MPGLGRRGGHQNRSAMTLRASGAHRGQLPSPT
jgi:hypothetical protein